MTTTTHKVNYTEINCKSACNRVKGGFPYVWDLNIYRGCLHACTYCYALYSHQYIGSGDFYHDIYVKKNIIEQLEKQLSHPNWKREVVNLGGVTDNYQAIEAKYKLMPEVLKLLIKYKTPAIISTKSDLILRDYDLIDELSRITYVNVAATVTAMDKRIQRLLEPRTVGSARRFAMLKEFDKTNASTALHFMPITPYITDSEENIDQLFAYAQDSHVDYVLTGSLYLRGPTKPAFLRFVQEEFAPLYRQMVQLYTSGAANKAYKDELYQRVTRLRNKYALSNNYKKIMIEKMHKEQTAEQAQLAFEF
jgi:DNA repair photolyase